MNERRIQERTELGTFFTAVVDDAPTLCLAADISAGGVFLHSARPLPEPESTRPILMRFSLPGDRTMLWACGRVVREKASEGLRGTGVRFTYLPDNTRSRLESYFGAQEMAQA